MSTTQTESNTPASNQAKPANPPVKKKDGTRETVESILIAFVLAFLFRTFEAEAFVIPTGSMAPTLYGRHKESTCQQCHFPVVVGASHEVNPDSGLLLNGVRLKGALCTNCGFENPQMGEELAFNGDRILVNKWTYEFGDPDRWDVFVFKYPREPEINYIKRLVGLPGETIRIRGGNLHLVTDEGETVLRKSPDKQNALQIPVYDDNKPPVELINAGWPERWASVERKEGEGLADWIDTSAGWQPNPEKRSYTISADAGSEPQWLRYRHYLSLPRDWDDLEQGNPLSPRARLIGDFCGYNSTIGDRPFDAMSAASVDLGPFWVPDLTVEFDIEITDAKDPSELVIELCEGTSWYRCRIDPRTGNVELEEVNSQMNERVVELASGSSRMKGKGRYHVAFANVDDQLCLWINGRLVDLGEGALLNAAGATSFPLPEQQDLTPVGIAAKGLSATVSNLLIKRDIYYRAASIQYDGQQRMMMDDLNASMTNPERWGAIYQRYSPELTEREISVGPDHYLAFGDNSPQSNDSRLWHDDMADVPRKYLVGKAFWIYWPHGVPFMNNGKGYPVLYHTQDNGQKVEDYPRYTVPFYPQFWRMQRIR